jgi:uncharacterized protein YbjT (DUF2867 family)
MSKKIITIVGATGTQGGSVLKALLSSPHRSSYHLRAITRNPSSPSALALSSQGVSLIKADLNDLSSLTTAFADSHIIFGVTDWATLFHSSQSAEVATATEIQQGTNLYLAAKATKTLEHYIWSTTASPSLISNGKWKVAYLDSKASVDALIKKDKEMLAKTTFSWVTTYAVNMKLPVIKPVLENGIWVQRLPVGEDAAQECIGDANKNVGTFIRAIIENEDKVRNGKYVLGSVEMTTAGKMLSDWGKATGRETRFEKVGMETYVGMYGKFAELMGAGLAFWEEYGVNGWSAGSGEVVLKKEDLGIKDEDLVSVSEAFERMSFE